MDLTYKKGNPGYRNMRGATYAHVDYKYRYSAPTERLGVLSACQGNRQEVKKLNPRRLGYKKGQTIVFNAARDAIFFDFPSIFYLMINSEREIDARNFHGFSDIQNLALRFPCPDNIKGVSDLKDQLFTGLKGEIATLKSLLSLSAAKKIVMSDIKVKQSDLIAKANLLSSQVRVVHEFESSANFDLDMLFSPQIF